MSLPDNPVYGIELLLYGQLLASVVAWAVMTVKVARVTGRSLWRFLSDNVPYVAETVLIGAVMWVESLVIANCWILLFAQACTALLLYIGVNHLLHSVIQREVVAYLRGRSSF